MGAKSGLSSANLIDVSFAGSTVKIGDVEITNFADDANPVEFPDVEVSSFGVNLNGILVRHAKPNAVIMSVSVIPGSKDDADLYDLWLQYRIQDGKNNSNVWAKSISADITLQNGSVVGKKVYNFTGGTMVSGPGGPASNGEGKMLSRTYTFAFAKVTA